MSRLNLNRSSILLAIALLVSAFGLAHATMSLGGTASTTESGDAPGRYQLFTAVEIDGIEHSTLMLDTNTGFLYMPVAKQDDEHLRWVELAYH